MHVSNTVGDLLNLATLREEHMQGGREGDGGKECGRGLQEETGPCVAQSFILSRILRGVTCYDLGFKISFKGRSSKNN